MKEVVSTIHGLVRDFHGFVLKVQTIIYNIATARRPLTPTVASPTSTHRPFSERKPRRSGVKGSPLRMVRTPPNRGSDQSPSVTFYDLPATPLTSKTLNRSMSQYATPI